MHGVVASRTAAGDWILGATATLRKRESMRLSRLAESQEAEQWWHAERQKILDGELVPEVTEMYAQSLSFPKFDGEFRRFWQVPADFRFGED